MVTVSPPLSLLEALRRTLRPALEMYVRRSRSMVSVSDGFLSRYSFICESNPGALVESMRSMSALFFCMSSSPCQMYSGMSLVKKPYSRSGKSGAVS